MENLPSNNGRGKTHGNEIYALPQVVTSNWCNSSVQLINTSWDLVVHPVTQVIGEQALVDILDLSRLPGPVGGISTPTVGLGLRMVKELDP